MKFNTFAYYKISFCQSAKAKELCIAERDIFMIVLKAYIRKKKFVLQRKSTFPKQRLQAY